MVTYKSKTYSKNREFLKDTSKIEKPEYKKMNTQDFNNGVCNLFPLYVFVYDKELRENAIKLNYYIKIYERVNNAKNKNILVSWSKMIKRESKSLGTTHYYINGTF